MLQPIVGFSVESESIIHVTFLSYTYVHLRKLLTVLTRMHVLILDYLVNRYSYNKIYYSSWLPSSKYTDKYILVHVAPSLSGLDIKTLFTMVEKSLVSHAFVMHDKRLNLNWCFAHFGEWIRVQTFFKQRQGIMQ